MKKLLIIVSLIFIIGCNQKYEIKQHIQSTKINNNDKICPDNNFIIYTQIYKGHDAFLGKYIIYQNSKCVTLNEIQCTALEERLVAVEVLSQIKQTDKLNKELNK